MAALTRGTLAKQAGVNGETLRYYEREGLLPEPKRSESGYRLYREDDVKRVRFIKRAQELGFNLREIKELLALTAEDDNSVQDVKKLSQQKIHEIQEKIDSLEAMKKTLTKLVRACSGKGKVEHCPIIQSLI